MVHIHFICKHVRAFVRILIATSCIVYLLSWFKIQRPDVSIRGSLNIHRWDSLCGFTVDDLRSHEFFPNRPNWKSFVYGLESTVSSTNIGQRIFGYIRAPTSGHYQFSISSDDFSELWLSSNENPNNASLICHIGGRDEEKGTFVFGWTGPSEFNKYESQMSRRIHLTEGRKYFVEVLHKQHRGLAHVHVVWKLPDSQDFVNINSEHIFSYVENNTDFSWYPSILKQHKVTHKKHMVDHYRKLTSSPVTSKVNYLRDNFNLLPKCNSSAQKIKLKRYESIHFVRTPKVYPADGSNNVLLLCEGHHVLSNCKGNSLLSKKEASRIVHKYLKSALPKEYSLTSIIKVEEFAAKFNASMTQFILDIEVMNTKTGQVARITEHMWENLGDKTLCKPGESSWDPDVMVYVIVTVKNQGFWLRHFIDTLVYIQEQTDDSNIHPIIVDFGSQDVGLNDTEIYLERCPLKHYTVIHKTGTFHKTAAINEAAASVKDNNSIVFQLDLHLDLPFNLMETVRKHTVQGKLAFAPILMRLACGGSPDVAVGFWEDAGYGLFSIYKSDWIRFGGMNEKEFTNRWGGEDWDMLDRVIMHNIEVQNLKMPGLFHYYHSKAKLWRNAA